jgi:hypothetical protein
MDFCEPDHVARYRDYWLPLYGTRSRVLGSQS